jgi:hypothetical protein
MVVEHDLLSNLLIEDHFAGGRVAVLEADCAVLAREVAILGVTSGAIDNIIC